MIIYFFGVGGGGSLEANIERWKKQFNAPAGDSAKVDKLKVGDVDVTTVDVSGTYRFTVRPGDENVTEKPNFRMVGVYFGSKMGRTYIKFVGPAKTMDKHMKDFNELAEEFQVIEENKTQIALDRRNLRFVLHRLPCPSSTTICRPRLIAQEPAAERDQSRIMVVRRADQSIAHHIIRRFAEPARLRRLARTQRYQSDSRSIARPARAHQRKMGRAFFCAKWMASGRCSVRRAAHWLRGEIVLVEPGASATGVLSLTFAGRTPDGHFLFRPSTGHTHELLTQFGHVPLPPYIRKGLDRPADIERYQTVFAHKPGAVAAPTAGLHFTEHVFDRLDQRGIRHTFVTLHVGLGTFQPMQPTIPRSM